MSYTRELKIIYRDPNNSQDFIINKLTEREVEVLLNSDDPNSKEYDSLPNHLKK